MTVLWERLKKLKTEVKEINIYMASYAQKLSLARQQLEIVQTHIASQLNKQALFDQEKAILIDIQRQSSVEEQMLRQKYRACWIDSGDANTKYFHAQHKIKSA